MHVSVIDNPDGTVVVTVRGDLDSDSGEALLESLESALAVPSPRIVVDLLGVGSCDEAGLGAVVTGHLRVTAAGGWLRLAASDDRREQLLSAVGPGPALPVYATVIDALSAP